MKVKFNQFVKWSLNGESFCFNDGDIADIDRDIGRRMVENGYAEVMKDGKILEDKMLKVKLSKKVIQHKNENSANKAVKVYKKRAKKVVEK